jgi:hypothetical protein
LLFFFSRCYSAIIKIEIHLSKIIQVSFAFAHDADSAVALDLVSIPALMAEAGHRLHTSLLPTHQGILQSQSCRKPRHLMQPPRPPWRRRPRPRWRSHCSTLPPVLILTWDSFFPVITFSHSFYPFRTSVFSARAVSLWFSRSVLPRSLLHLNLSGVKLEKTSLGKLKQLVCRGYHRAGYIFETFVMRTVIIIQQIRFLKFLCIFCVTYLLLLFLQLLLSLLLQLLLILI